MEISAQTLYRSLEISVGVCVFWISYEQPV